MVDIKATRETHYLNTICRVSTNKKIKYEVENKFLAHWDRQNRAFHSRRSNWIENIKSLNVATDV